jgi:nucleoside-diphosphate-sugar epimerase
MVQHALDRGYEVVGVCREESVAKLDTFKGRITIVPGATDDREVIKRAVAGCDAVLVVLVPLCFVDEGSVMAAMLQAAHARGIAPDYTARLLTAFSESDKETRRSIGHRFLWSPGPTISRSPSLWSNHSAHVSWKSCA